MHPHNYMLIYNFMLFFFIFFLHISSLCICSWGFRAKCGGNEVNARRRFGSHTRSRWGAVRTHDALYYRSAACMHVFGINGEV